MKSSRSPYYVLNWQFRIRCYIDCMIAPQSHFELSLNFCVCMSSLFPPCPMRILLSLTRNFPCLILKCTRHLLLCPWASLSVFHLECQWWSELLARMVFEIYTSSLQFHFRTLATSDVYQFCPFLLANFFVSWYERVLSWPGRAIIVFAQDCAWYYAHDLP